MADVTLATLAVRNASGTGDTLDTSNVALLRLTLASDSGDSEPKRGRATRPAGFRCFIETREPNGAWRVIHSFKEGDRIASGAGSLYGLSGYPIGNFRCVVAPDAETRCRWELERGSTPDHVPSPELVGSLAFSVTGTSVEGA